MRFENIAKSGSTCIDGFDREVYFGPTWIQDCREQFTLVNTVERPTIINPQTEVCFKNILVKQSFPQNFFQARTISVVSGMNAIFVSPRTGMWFHSQGCSGSGIITIYYDDDDPLYFTCVMIEHQICLIGSACRCATIPAWIISFDLGLELRVDNDVEYVALYSSSLDSSKINFSRHILGRILM